MGTCQRLADRIITHNLWRWAPVPLSDAGPMSDFEAESPKFFSDDHFISYKFVIMALRVRRGSVEVRRMIITSRLSAGRSDRQAVNGIKNRRARGR